MIAFAATIYTLHSTLLHITLTLGTHIIAFRVGRSRNFPIGPPSALALLASCMASK